MSRGRRNSPGSRLWLAGCGLILAITAAVPSGARQRAGSPPPQTPPAAPQQPTFRAGTRTVPIYVSVTDQVGAFVMDLTKDEFEVRDDGRVQEITQFTTDTQPISAIVLMDGSRSMVNALDLVMEAADHFVVRLMPGDRARVGSFSEDIRFSPAFTSDRDALARQVNDLFALRVGPVTRLWDAICEATSLFEAGEGRRVVIAFTDGDDTWSTNTFEDALSRARRSEVMVYAVVLRGIQRLPEDRSRRRPSASFTDLAVDTGGGYYIVTNKLADLNSVATEIAEELHSQYVVGFLPAQLDGRLHKLEVRVNRPKVKVRARQSYVADAERIGGGRP
jgi:Ca-activated chloride channel homolog